MYTALGAWQSIYLRTSEPRSRASSAAPKHYRAFREVHEGIFEKKIRTLYSVNRRMSFAKPNIKDILRRAAALHSVLGVVAVVLLIRTRIAKIELLVIFRSSEK